MRHIKAEIGIQLIEQAVVEYIEDQGGLASAVDIKNELCLNMPCVPLASGNDQGGWVFAAVARRLEERGIIDYHLDDLGRGQCSVIKGWSNA